MPPNEKLHWAGVPSLPVYCIPSWRLSWWSTGQWISLIYADACPMPIFLYAKLAKKNWDGEEKMARFMKCPWLSRLFILLPEILTQLKGHIKWDKYAHNHSEEGRCWQHNPNWCLLELQEGLNMSNISKKGCSTSGGCVLPTANRELNQTWRKLRMEWMWQI